MELGWRVGLRPLSFSLPTGTEHCGFRLQLQSLLNTLHSKEKLIWRVLQGGKRADATTVIFKKLMAPRLWAGRQARRAVLFTLTKNPRTLFWPVGDFQVEAPLYGAGGTIGPDRRTRSPFPRNIDPISSCCNRERSSRAVPPIPGCKRCSRQVGPTDLATPTSTVSGTLKGGPAATGWLGPGAPASRRRSNAL